MSRGLHPTTEELSAWREGDLPPSRAEEIARHVQGCPECTSEVEGLDSLLRELTTMPFERAPEGFLERVNSRIEEVERSPTSWLFWKRLLRPGGLTGGVLVVAATAAVALFFLRSPELAKLEVGQVSNEYKTMPAAEVAQPRGAREDQRGVLDQAAPAGRPPADEPAADERAADKERSAPSPKAPSPSLQAAALKDTAPMAEADQLKGVGYFEPGEGLDISGGAGRGADGGASAGPAPSAAASVGAARGEAREGELTGDDVVAMKPGVSTEKKLDSVRFAPAPPAAPEASAAAPAKASRSPTSAPAAPTGGVAQGQVAETAEITTASRSGLLKREQRDVSRSKTSAVPPPSLKPASALDGGAVMAALEAAGAHSVVIQPPPAPEERRAATTNQASPVEANLDASAAEASAGGQAASAGLSPGTTLVLVVPLESWPRVERTLRSMGALADWPAPEEGQDPVRVTVILR